MPFCENCGNNVSDTSKFCSNCGEPIKKVEFINETIQPTIPNNQSHLKIPAKKSGYLKYIMLFAAVVVIASLYFIGNSKNNYNSNGYKHGDWVEYINDDGSLEVPKDSAKIIRHITYYHGTPVDIVKDYYPNGNIQSEFELSSDPYTKNGARPKDKMWGYAVFFDEQTSKINGFSYFDDNGEIDIEKTLSLAFQKAKEDPRFDSEFFSKTEFGLWFNQNSLIILNRLSHRQDELSAIGSGKEFENTSGISDNQNYESSRKEEKKCSYCNGTGRCPTCNKVFSMTYFDENGSMWKNRNETKPGYVKCESCFGKGYRGGGRNLQGPIPKETCYNNCLDGWLYCTECNYSGRGAHFGECSHCKGSGISN